jgi:hypothetical protein
MDYRGGTWRASLATSGLGTVMPIRQSKWVFAVLAAFLCILAGAAWAADKITDIDPATGRDYSCEMLLGIQGCETLGMITGPAKPKTPKTDVWGAVAVAPNLDWGYSHNYKTQKEAEAVALSSCKGLHGAQCKIAATVPGYCLSLAMSNGDRKWGVSGITGALNVAEPDSISHCNENSCAIAISFCADGVRHVWQPPGGAKSGLVMGPDAPAKP